MRFRQFFVVLWVLSSALLCLSLSGCKSEKTESVVESLPKEIPVTVQPVKEVMTNNVISVSGTLVADKTAPLGFLVPGRVDLVKVDEGDKVNKGDLLATIESQDYKNSLDMAKAAVLRASDAYKRYEPLYKEGAFAEKNIIVLKANLAEARAARNIAAKALKDTRLYSPITGIVGSKSIELGQMVSAQSPAFTIVKTDLIYARVPVPETEIDQVTMGKAAQVSISALQGRTFTGKVTMIGAVADVQARTYPVKVELQNQDLLLRPGMIAQTNIQCDRPLTVLTVPGVAIVRDADTITYVFVVDQHSKTAHLRRVTPGNAYKDGIVIRDGLKAGELIVVAGQNKLADGTAVTLLSAEQETSPSDLTTREVRQ